MSLNSDIGEGFGVWSVADDRALLELVTDANVACGFHAGDPDILLKTCRDAAELGVTVGAQVGYFDLRGFGRRFIDVPPASLAADVLYQVGALDAIARACGLSVTYLKVHGALYHACVQRPDMARAIADGLSMFGRDVPVMCQPGTPFAVTLASAGCRLLREGYLDRAYQPDGLLVPRGQEGAMITDPDAAALRAVQIATTGTVTAIDGSVLPLEVDSVCIHSDSPGALEIAQAVRAALEGEGVALRGILA
ncbi:LamB/YcsF family protein [Micromonospora sp. NBC_01655]|uniref:LamB/YcsF family protein n=1 Tax=Micromonospora sp. NBC_01655 TaxID=2975983 RepID=UPI0022530C1B|nr:5-oxoprolinase subunit PxpA [Micromonospora sp. NBC_01655]MCX4469594.1 LamB/YcsF family protein [Micromonospora sp. NBC_01655]